MDTYYLVVPYVEDSWLFIEKQVFLAILDNNLICSLHSTWCNHGTMGHGPWAMGVVVPSSWNRKYYISVVYAYVFLWMMKHINMINKTLWLFLFYSHEKYIISQNTWNFTQLFAKFLQLLLLRKIHVNCMPSSRSKLKIQTWL